MTSLPSELKTYLVVSKQHIFDPLGMETSSFYLTPNLKRRLVDLSFRAPDHSLNPWADQIPIMEQDPEKGLQDAHVYKSITYDHPPLVRLHLGGVGMYSSMRDYLKILRHILQIHGKEDQCLWMYGGRSISHILSSASPCGQPTPQRSNR